MERYPLLSAWSPARDWLTIWANLGHAPNTIDTYARALEDYLRFSEGCGVAIDEAGREHLATYVRDLNTRGRSRGHAASGPLSWH